MHIDWYFDAISPFAWLQWPAVRALTAEHDVSLKPVMLAGLLETLGQLGPAEIPGKREFTYRHALWRARVAGIPMRFPPAHPFNPLFALRLCIAADSTPEAVESVMSWIWRDGRAADNLDALQPLMTQMAIPPEALGAAEVKAGLRANFDDAIAAGVFGVPTLVIAGQCFWGEDATAMARDFLRDPQLFDDPDYTRLTALPVGARREAAR